MAGFGLSFIDRPPVWLVTIVLKMTDADASGEILGSVANKTPTSQAARF
jgi:hypothetical protein